ncbi:hypothetical protein GDO86_003706 [Hymenochirus boettgeri]|uniref:Zinc finger and BTB domain-containing protein 8A n=1 Tax=Hymenochirus boettgeri TaxID=247094 RepID=A0A8T2KAJ9_9PIPI|nr:hypothetical protein GDO86_003706 [Hymenochirus boettgeri]
MDLSSHHSRLLQQLDEQRRRDLFCDCHIVIEGQTFRAHRNVLFASSGYFKMLLSQSCGEVGQPTTATFDVFSADTFKAILDFMYSGKLPISGQNVIEIMSAASYLQMTEVISVCKMFIKSSLDINEKDRDGFFGISEKAPGQQSGSDCSLYNTGWAMDRYSSNQSEEDIAGYLEPTYNPYGFCPRTDEITPQNSNLTAPNKISERHNRTTRMPSSNSSPEENVKESRFPGTDGSGYHIEVELPQGENSEVFLNCHKVIRQRHRRRSSINIATKAEEAYAKIMGIKGSLGEDNLPIVHFKCPFCTHTVKRKADLKRHLLCHTGERPYPCQACGKRFTRLEHVRNHYRTIHEAVKPVCRWCKRHVTEESGQVVQEGTRRFRLCIKCVSEIGAGNVPKDAYDDDEPTIVLSGDEDKEPSWNFQNGLQTSDTEIHEDVSSDLVIHKVDDIDEDIKPIIC